MTKLIRRRGERPGFTMIELLTVIGIIVILMSILIPVISRVRIQGQITDSTHLMVKLSEACNAYFTDFHAYPGPLPDNAVHGFNNSILTDTHAPNATAFAAAFALGGTVYNPNSAGAETAVTGGTPFTDVTSSQNLVLGLLGGLTYIISPSQAVVYDNTLVTRGPQVLNPLGAQQIPSYVDVGKYDLFQDGAGNYSSGALPLGTYLIPEFIDHFSQPNPIIYLRARTGAAFACDVPLVAGSSGSQYYSGEMWPYAPNFFTQPDRYNNFTTAYPASTSGVYGVQFFSNPVLDNLQNITPRGKDSFILISAGPDGAYGTKDDIVLPSN